MGVKYSRGKWKKQHMVQQWNVELAEVLLIPQVQWQIRPNQVFRSKAGFVIGCRAETFGEAVVEGRMLNKLFSIIMDNQDQCVHHQCTLFSIILNSQSHHQHTDYSPSSWKTRTSLSTSSMHCTDSGASSPRDRDSLVVWRNIFGDHPCPVPRPPVAWLCISLSAPVLQLHPTVQKDSREVGWIFQIECRCEC